MNEFRLNFAEVIEYGSVVHYDDELGLYFTWNGHRTFNVFWEMQGKFCPSDCFLTDNEPATDSWAKQACKDYVQRVLNEMNEEEYA
jgi:hypothetical protein